jgi:hypothetical protein
VFRADLFAKRGQGVGYNRVILDGKVVEEHDTAQCCHCNTTMFLNPLNPPPWCSCCNRHWCGGLACFKCEAFEKKLEKEEAIDRQKRLLWQEADNR